jgi:hypothetical protein
MYKYKFTLWINKNGAFYTKSGFVEFPKERYSWTVNDPDKRLICRKAASEIGEDPNNIDFSHSSTTLQCVGVVKSPTPANSSSSSSSSKSYSAPVSSGPSFEEKLRMKEIEAEERDKKAQADLEREKFEYQKSQEEKAERKAKANQLRREGKPFLAFIVEYQNAVIAAVAIPVVALAFYFMMQSSDNETAEATRINLELEQIEDSVKILIQEKNFDRALVLANKLVHPIGIVYDGKGTEWEPMYYDQYWDQKRSEYKEIIAAGGELKMETQESTPKKKVKTEESTPTEVEESTQEPEPEIIYEEGLSDEYKY